MMLNKFLDVRHPFFLPAWRRVVAVVLPLLWGLVEIGQGAFLWAAIFIGAGLYLGWAFFIAWDAAEVEAMRPNGDKPPSD